MKNILKLSLLVVLIYSCSSTKQETIIPYVLDISTEKSIYEEIVNKSNFGFYIQNINDSQFKVYLIDIKEKELLKTNRMLFVNNKFYPIIFESDYLFYSKLKDEVPIVSYEYERNKYKNIPMPSIQQREKESELYGYPKKKIIIDNSVFWIIDKKGKLISKGTTTQL